MSQPEWEEIERRVARIERQLGLAQQVAGPNPPLPAAERPKLETTALLPVLGRALLGLAGAYLLRALTESGTLPHQVGVAVGLAYAVMWLVWAARTPAAQRLEAALHSLTAVLVLAPLLWEAALRFHAISTWTAGGILLFFTVFGLAVSWRKDLLIVATIATLAGLGTAAALLVATHDVLPFTGVILAIAAAVEACACLDHWPSERWLAATVADLSVLLATWLVTNERGLPAAYAPIPHGWLLFTQMALLAIYLSSTFIRTLLRGSTFTTFEMVQCAAAFLISVSGGLRLAAEDPRLGPAMAGLTLVCGAACYGMAFLRSGRNFHVYSSFAILLLLVGLRIALPPATVDAVLPALAVFGAWAGRHFQSVTFQVHGAICLLLSQISPDVSSVLLGSATWSGESHTMLIAGVLAAGLCYALALDSSQLFRLALAAVLLWLAAGLAAGALPPPFRTSLIAAAALLLAWSGARWKRLELTRLAYPAMLLGSYRLLMLDLHRESTAALFLSLLVYGGVLIVMPRVKRAT